MSTEALSIAAEVLRTCEPITVGTLTGTTGPGIEFIERRVYNELLTKAKALARYLEAIELENRHGK